MQKQFQFSPSKFRYNPKPVDTTDGSMQASEPLQRSRRLTKPPERWLNYKIKERGKKYVFTGIDYERCCYNGKVGDKYGKNDCFLIITNT